jgi:hypothetical protein
MTQTTAADKFSNFDEPDVYSESLERNLRDAARNFIVEFGPDEARIAFNVSTEGVSKLLVEKRSLKLPVRWM